MKKDWKKEFEKQIMELYETFGEEGNESDYEIARLESIIRSSIIEARWEFVELDDHFKAMFGIHFSNKTVAAFVVDSGIMLIALHEKHSIQIIKGNLCEKKYLIEAISSI